MTTEMLIQQAKEKKTNKNNFHKTKLSLSKHYIRLLNYSRVLKTLNEERFVMTADGPIEVSKSFLYFIEKEILIVEILLGIIRKTLNAQVNFIWVCDKLIGVSYSKIHKYMLNGEQPNNTELTKMISFINN